MLSFLTGEDRRTTLTMLLQVSELTEENKEQVHELLTRVEKIYDLRTAQELECNHFHAGISNLNAVRHGTMTGMLRRLELEKRHVDYHETTCVTAIHAIPPMDKLLSALLKNPFLRDREQETVFKWIKLILVLLLLALPYDVDDYWTLPFSDYRFFRHDQKKITLPECKAKYLEKKLPRNVWDLLNKIQKRELAPGNNAQQEIIKMLSNHTFTFRKEGRGDITEALYFAFADRFASLAKKERAFCARDAYGEIFKKPHRENTYKQLLLNTRLGGLERVFPDTFNQFYTQKEQEEWALAGMYLLAMHLNYLSRNEEITGEMPSDIMGDIFSMVKTNTNTGQP